MWLKICHRTAGCWPLHFWTLSTTFLCEHKLGLLTDSMLSCLGLWFHSDIELILLQGLHFVNKNTTHRMEQQVSIVWELVHLHYSCYHIFPFQISILTINYTCLRGMSSAHAIFITAVSLYLVASTDLFSDRIKGPITFRNSIISTSALGVRIPFIPIVDRVAFII